MIGGDPAWLVFLYSKAARLRVHSLLRLPNICLNKAKLDCDVEIKSSHWSGVTAFGLDCTLRSHLQLRLTRRFASPLIGFVFCVCVCVGERRGGAGPLRRAGCAGAKSSADWLQLAAAKLVNFVQSFLRNCYLLFQVTDRERSCRIEWFFFCPYDYWPGHAFTVHWRLKRWSKWPARIYMGET